MRKTAKWMRSCIVAAALAITAIVPVIQTAPAAQAQDMINLPHGQSRAVLKHNICRVVKNTTGQGIMIPLRDPEEWNGGSSFIRHAANFPGIGIARCMPGGGEDAALCFTHTRPNHYLDYCRSSSWKVLKQSSFLPVSVDDRAEWGAAISWAQNNLGKPASARPDNVLPACYTNSSLNQLARTPDDTFVPPGSDFCIVYFHTTSVPQNSSSGPEWTAGVTIYRRVWRS